MNQEHFNKAKQNQEKMIEVITDGLKNKLELTIVLVPDLKERLMKGLRWSFFLDEKTNLSTKTKLTHIYLDAPEFKIKQRIIERNNIRDEWKINNWQEFAKRLKKPKAIIENEVLTFNTEEEFGQQEKLLLDQLNRR